MRALLYLVALLLCGAAALSSADETALGRKTAVVIVARYPGTQTPFSATRWARELESRAGGYYAEATSGKTHLHFLGAPGEPVRLPFDYNGKKDDPQSIFDEGYAALNGLDEAHPEFWAEHPQVDRVVVIVNRPKRGRATRGPTLPFASRRTGLLRFGITVISHDEAEPITDSDVTLVCHELGHTLGLPDLYHEPEDKDPVHFKSPEYTGAWCLMGYDSLQDFCGYSRRHLGWINRGPRLQDQQIRILARPGGSQPLVRTFRISPPQTGGAVELLLLPLDPLSVIRTPDGSLSEPPLAPNGTAAPFNGFMVETRWYANRDATGLPKEYQPGVLITRCYPRPSNPIEVVPRVRIPTDDGAGDLSLAAFPPGTVFHSDQTDDDVGLHVQVVREIADGSAPDGTCEVRVTWQPPPRLDLVAYDLWLDAPHNSFSDQKPYNPQRYERPLAGDGLPGQYGDPVFVQATPKGPAFVPHRLHFSVSNAGNVAALQAHATLFILGPDRIAEAAQRLSTLPTPTAQAPPLPTVEQAMLALGAERHDVVIGPMARGGSFEGWVEFTPRGGFGAVLVVSDTAAGQPVPEAPLEQFNNLRLEPFIVPHLAFGSPYPTVELPLAVTNPNETSRVFFASPASLPDGWTARVQSTTDPERVEAVLQPGQEETFRLLLQPPPPTAAKPGMVQTLELAAWMEHADTYIPVAQIPVPVVFNYPTGIGASVTSLGPTKAVVNGRLFYHELNSLEDRPVPNAPVLFSLLGSDDSVVLGGPDNPALTARTNASGEFQVSVNLRQGVRYQLVAQYGGSARFAGAESAPVAIGQKGPDLSAAWIGINQSFAGTGTGRRWTLTGAATLRNQGPQRAGASRARFLLSDDALPDAGDRALQDVTLPELPPAGTRRAALNVTLPRGLNPKGRYVILVLDVGGVVSELSEENNRAIYGPLR